MYAFKTALVALSLAVASPALANGVIYLPDMKFPTESSETVTKDAGSARTSTSVNQGK